MAKRKIKRIYRANDRAGYDHDIAAWIGQQIEIAEESGGVLTPQLLVNLSRPQRSPGHKLFNWDVQSAAEAHWIERAQYYLRHLDIEIIYEGSKQPIRATYPVTLKDNGDGNRAWVSFDKLQSSPDLTRQVIEKAASELRAWRSRYALYKNVFGPVFDAINQVEEQLWVRQKQSIASCKTAKPRAKSSRSSRPRKAR